MNWFIFLKDVFRVALSSFGGPEAHYAIFSRELVDKKKYLTSDELLQLIALYSLVPGPSSTQTIMAIGYKVGGPLLALLSFFVWAFPAMVLMILFAIFYPWIQSNPSYLPSLTYLPPLAIGFMIFGSIIMVRKSVKKIKDGLIFSAMLFLAFFFQDYGYVVFPVLLILGGVFYLSLHSKELSFKAFSARPTWIYLTAVITIGIILFLLSTVVDHPMMQLAEVFYRFGYTVIGGGQVVIPMMIKELVTIDNYVTISEFLSGYAIDQAVPGPLFSFAAFVGAMTFESTSMQIIGGLISGFAIFLPGILLVFFIYPFWKQAKELKGFQYFLKGVMLTATSLVVLVAITQFVRLPLYWDVWMVAMVSSMVLLSKKISPPVLVVLMMVLGFLL
jgi:chromate transporter